MNTIRYLVLLVLISSSGGVFAVDIRGLDENEVNSLNSHREWVQDLVTNGFQSNFIITKTKSDLPMLQTLIEKGPYTEDPINELVVFGTVYGDILANELGLSWVVVTDEAGSDFALRYKNYKIFLFPQDMILKRFEENKELDLVFMLGELEKTVSDLANDEDVQRE